MDGFFPLVTGLTGMAEEEAAWRRLTELTRTHRCHQLRTRITGDGTRVLNEEGYGIESPDLTKVRRSDYTPK